MKLVAALAVVLVAAAFFALGGHEHLTVESVKARWAELESLYDARPAATMAGLFLAYVVLTAASLPGGAVATLAAGALFGAVTATVLVSFASSIGATLAFFLSRYVLRDWVEARFGARLRRLEGDDAFYLFLLRLLPVVPFFLVNLGMGATRIRPWTYYWVSQLGMLPGSFLFASAGANLADIESPWDVLTPGVLLPLAALGLLPLAGRKFFMKKRGSSDGR